MLRLPMHAVLMTVALLSTSNVLAAPGDVFDVYVEGTDGDGIQVERELWTLPIDITLYEAGTVVDALQVSHVTADALAAEIESVLEHVTKASGCVNAGPDVMLCFGETPTADVYAFSTFYQDGAGFTALVDQDGARALYKATYEAANP